MKLRALLVMVFQSIRSHPRDFLYSCIGLLVSVGMLTFAFGLGEGVRVNIVDVVFPIDLLEVEPATKLGEISSDRPFGFVEGDILEFEKVPGVSRVFPKQKAVFKARMWGGEGLLGKNMSSEAFFDGVEAELVQGDLDAARVESPTENGGRKIPCMNDDECFAEMSCEAGYCEPVTLSERFEQFDMFHPCDGNHHCPLDAECIRGRCRDKVCAFSENDCEEGKVCTAVSCAGDDECGGGEGSCQDGWCNRGVCFKSCNAMPGGSLPRRGGCPLESWCMPHACGDDSHCDGATCMDGFCGSMRVCENIPCALRKLSDATGDDEALARGYVTSICADGSIPASGEECDLPLPCLSGTICSTENSSSRKGYCERTVPVLFNPLLVELLGGANLASGATELSLSEDSALIGTRFRVEAGASYVQTTAGLPKNERRTMRCEVVAMSDVPSLYGGTVPLSVVRGLNGRFGGREQSNYFQSLVLEISEGERFQDVLDTAKAMGAQPAGASAIASRVGALVFWMTLIFLVLGGVVLVLSAINIGHTMLMIVHERRREIGVMRCIGALRKDVRRMVLIEAAIAGGFGSCMGVLATFLASIVLDNVLPSFLEFVPFVPESFFVFNPLYLCLVTGLGVMFATIGAWVPALTAAQIEPAILVRES